MTTHLCPNLCSISCQHFVRDFAIFASDLFGTTLHSKLNSTADAVESIPVECQKVDKQSRLPFVVITEQKMNRSSSCGHKIEILGESCAEACINFISRFILIMSRAEATFCALNFEDLDRCHCFIWSNR